MPQLPLRRFLSIFVAAGALTLSGCTSVGLHRGEVSAADFGERETLNMCYFQDEGISDERARELASAISAEAALYGIDAVPAQFIPWKRPAFFGDDIVLSLLSETPLGPGCDRNFAFVGRNLGDILFGNTVGTEVLGAVDLATHTRGFAFANSGTFTQLLLSPTHVAVHEFYHLLGCEHSLTMDGCHRAIKALKVRAKETRVSGADFFPGVHASGAFLYTREDADSVARTSARDFSASRAAQAESRYFSQ